MEDKETEWNTFEPFKKIYVKHWAKKIGIIDMIPNKKYAIILIAWGIYNILAWSTNSFAKINFSNSTIVCLWKIKKTTYIKKVITSGIYLVIKLIYQSL